MSMGRKQGEQVTLSYSATAIPSTAALIAVFDSNGVARPLQVYERLILDKVQFDSEATDTTNLAYLVAGVTAPSVPASGSVPAAPIITSFTVQQGLPDQGDIFPGEGESLPVAANVYLVVPGTGLAGTVSVNGTGRIINGTTRGVRAGYKAHYTPGSNDINA